MRTPFTLLGCLVGVAFASAGDARAPADDVPELRVLRHWLGKWDVTMAIKPSENTPKEINATGSATAEWILDGRFLQQTGSLDAVGDMPAAKTTMIMTWDERKKTYRSWWYFSNGNTDEMEGTWDERTRTMTSLSRDAASGITTTIKASFPQDGVEVWSILAKDRDGKVIHESTGKNTHKKP